MAKIRNLEFRHHNLLTDYASSPILEVAATATDGLAFPVTHPMITKVNAGAEANTLADGEPGQVLNIYMTTAVGASTLTPATSTGWATIVLDTAGDQCTLLYVDDTVGWIIIGATGVAQPPVISI